MFSVNDALDEIKRGVAEIIDEDRLKKVLEEYIKSGKSYTVKAGFDPTSADIHLGHTVLLQKLSIFQKFGATVQLLVGDFTATIGDPTGKNAMRKPLTKEEVLENAKTYQEQVFKILDRDKTEVVYNSKWLEGLGANGIIGLCMNQTVARMLERDDFHKRFTSQTPIAISEFIYPLLQGYDSVYLKSDIEIGGTDQKFNLLMGRQLQKAYNIGKEQVVLMMPLLEGLDGVAKMSKSLGNYIGVTDDPNDMFGKVLSISDELMWRYYELLSSKSSTQIEELKEGIANGSLHPKAIKESLAMEIVERYHSADEAIKAKEEFDRVHKQSQIPTDIESFELESDIWIAKALVDAKLEPSTSQARRDIKQGALKIDGQQVKDEQLKLSSGEYVLQVGKRRFAKVKVL